MLIDSFSISELILCFISTLFSADAIQPSCKTPSTDLIWMDLLLLLVMVQTVMHYFPRKLEVEEVKFQSHADASYTSGSPMCSLV